MIMDELLCKASTPDERKAYQAGKKFGLAIGLKEGRAAGLREAREDFRKRFNPVCMDCGEELGWSTTEALHAGTEVCEIQPCECWKGRKT